MDKIKFEKIMYLLLVILIIIVAAVSVQRCIRDKKEIQQFINTITAINDSLTTDTSIISK